MGSDVTVGVVPGILVFINVRSGMYTRANYESREECYATVHSNSRKPSFAGF